MLVDGKRKVYCMSEISISYTDWEGNTNELYFSCDKGMYPEHHEHYTIVQGEDIHHKSLDIKLTWLDNNNTMNSDFALISGRNRK